jgi:hypothetical protein
MNYIFKGKLKGEEALMQDLSTNPDWMTIPYRCNRGLIFDGDFPHASAPVVAINRPDMKRVILGFNCFGDAVGPCCVRAPEHSDAFNRTIKIYQSVSSMSDVAGGDEEVYNNASNADTSVVNGPSSLAGEEVSSNCNKSATKGLTIEQVKANPFLKKLVLAAAKARKCV